MNIKQISGPDEEHQETRNGMGWVGLEEDLLLGASDS